MSKEEQQTINMALARAIGFAVRPDTGTTYDRKIPEVHGFRLVKPSFCVLPYGQMQPLDKTESEAWARVPKYCTSAEASRELMLWLSQQEKAWKLFLQLLAKSLRPASVSAIQDASLDLRTQYVRTMEDMGRMLTAPPATIAAAAAQALEA